MRRIALALALCGLVACSSGEPATVASTAKWRPAGARDARPHRGRRGARRPLRLRHGRLRAAAAARRWRSPSATTCAATAGAASRTCRPGSTTRPPSPTAAASTSSAATAAGARSTTRCATLYRYQPRRDRWTRLAPMPTARGALAAAVVGHRLYAVGGAATGRGALATLEVYDFRRRRWSAGPDLPLAREHLAAAAAARAGLRAGRPRRRAGQLRARRPLRPGAPPLGARARTWASRAAASPPPPSVAASRSSAARRTRARSARSSSTTRRATAGGRCLTCARRATASAASSSGRADLRDRGRRRARVPLHPLAGIPRRPTAVGGPARGTPSGPAPAGRRRGTGCRA